MEENESYKPIKWNDPIRKRVWKQMDKELGRTELEQAAGDYIVQLNEEDLEGGFNAAFNAFKAGAEWQKKQDEEELKSEEKLNHPLYLEGFDTGREVQKVFNELTWQDIKRIVNIADKMLDRELVKGANPITERLYYEQVLEKYKEQKNK